MASIFNFDHCDIKSSQVGENNSMVVRNFVSEDDWEELELFFNRKNKPLTGIIYAIFWLKKQKIIRKKEIKLD